MNIYILDANPMTRARYHHDEHLEQMIVAAELLICRTTRNVVATVQRKKSSHPWFLWVNNLPKLCWVVQHGMALADEYTARHGKTHSAADRIIAPINKMLLHYFPDEYDHARENKFLAYPVTAGIDDSLYRSYRPYANLRNAVASYREHYSMCESHGIWTLRGRPQWMIETECLAKPTINEE